MPDFAQTDSADSFRREDSALGRFLLRLFSSFLAYFY